MQCTLGRHEDKIRRVEEAKRTLDWREDSRPPRHAGRGPEDKKLEQGELGN